MTTCPICASDFAGRLGQIYCSKRCGNASRAKQIGSAVVNVNKVSGQMKQCDCCGITKPADAFDKTPKGAIRAACHECRREWRKKNKERIRRNEGCKQREQIAKEASDRRESMARDKELRAVFLANLFGPPRPGKWIGEAAFYAWRIANDHMFYARELDRAQAYKMRTRAGYKGSIIGWSEMPDDLILSKHLMCLISKQLKRSECNGKH